MHQPSQGRAGSTENPTYAYPTGANNGKIGSVYNAASGEAVSYTYDSLNRLLTATASGTGNWGERYGFDGFGNLLSKTVTAGSGPSMSVTVNPANNQAGGLSYDANGNVTEMYNGTQEIITSYDAENRMVGASHINGGPLNLAYAYDAQNRRIFSWAGATDYSGQGNPDIYQVTLYSPTGQRLGSYQIDVVGIGGPGTALYGIVSTLMTSDQYFGGRRLAMLDQLGSVVSSSQSYFPWGETKGTSNPEDTWNFATYWQDSATGLDYAQNRYYSNGFGRFMTPDPYKANGGGSGNPSTPQSWNRYAYVQNDPVNFIDPSGQNLAYPDACLNVWDWDASVTCDSGFYWGSGFIDLSTPSPPNPWQTLSTVRSAVTAAATAWLLLNESRAANASIPTYLKMTSECWLPDSGPGNTQSATYTLFVTYQILNQFGQPMSGNALSGTTISEGLQATTGNLSPGPPWQYGTATGIQSSGQFTDMLSSGGLPNFPNYIVAFQTFTASGTVGGVPFYQPLQVMGFGPTTSVLLDQFAANNVTVNGLGLGKNPATECPH